MSITFENERWPKQSDFSLCNRPNPPRTLNLHVISSSIVLITFRDLDPIHYHWPEPWSITRADVEGPCKQLWEAADKFRSKYSKDYFDILDSIDIDKHLKDIKSDVLLNNWEELTGNVDAKYQKSWEQVATSQELSKLAHRGYDLFRLFFPEGTERVNKLASLPVASRINILWAKNPFGGDSSWLPHIPWGLMFLNEPPLKGEPVDPLNFLGLRYRIEYLARQDRKEISRRLGAFYSTNKIYCLYWGAGARSKEMHKEVLWQKEKLQPWPKQTIAPSLNNMQPKSEIVSLFQNPRPTPINLFYFFCQCKINTSEGSPTLQFGDNPEDTLDQDDIGLKSFSDEPIIFANACSSAASDPYIVNILEARFFDRGCRAYIGTEIKVPIIFASRFAAIYFEIFYRLAQSRPISSGEAFMQTRIFLWRYFKNIGGLFYSYDGLYDLFMSHDSKNADVKDSID